MRARSLLLRVLPALLLAGTDVGAVAAEVWTPAPSANGMISVETPCAASEIAAMAAVPDSALSGFAFVSGSRVLCNRGKVLMLAGVVELPRAGSDPSVFDTFVEQAKNDKTIEGTPSTRTIDGRRAWVDRQEDGNRLAQTGVVEIDRSRVVFAIAGTQDGSGLSIEDQRALVERFYASIKVTGK